MGNKLGRLSAQSGQNFRRLMRGLGPFLIETGVLTEQKASGNYLLTACVS
jgi:hypothetical protein